MNEAGKYDKYGSVGSPNREQAILNDISDTLGQPEIVGVYKKRVVITDAQIKSLLTTDIELVEAPGAGKMLCYHSAVLRTNYIAPYNMTGVLPDTSIYFKYQGSTQVGCSFNRDESVDDVNDLLTVSQLIYYSGPRSVANLTSGNGYPLSISYNSSSINKPFVLSMFGTDANFTGGNPANTIEVTIFYSVIDL